MIWLLRVLFFGHCHKWKTIQKNNLVNTLGGKPVERGERYILQCEHCGKIIKRDMI
jgi:phage terminase large subunit GpA-like protein